MAPTNDIAITANGLKVPILRFADKGGSPKSSRYSFSPEFITGLFTGRGHPRRRRRVKLCNGAAGTRCLGSSDKPLNSVFDRTRGLIPLTPTHHRFRQCLGRRSRAPGFALALKFKVWRHYACLMDPRFPVTAQEVLAVHPERLVVVVVVTPLHLHPLRFVS